MSGFSNIDCNAEDTGVSFSPTICYGMGKTGKEWMENAESRAYATISLALDYMISFNDRTPDFTPNMFETSYIGKTGLDLVVIYKSDLTTDRLAVIFRPITGEASYLILENIPTDTQADYMMQTVCVDGYYKNDIEDIYMVYNDISNALGL